MQLLWLILVVCGLAVRNSMKRKLAWSSSDEEPLDEARNSVGSSSSRLERFNRLERIPDPPERPTLDQPFTRDLKYKWAKGKLSSADVQSLASNAMKQGAQDLDKLAAAGAHGILYFVLISHFLNKTNLFKPCFRIK